MKRLFKVSNTILNHGNRSGVESNSVRNHTSELDDTMSCYQLIITIKISHKSQSFIRRRALNSYF